MTADLRGRAIIAECKGGVINTKNSGQTSRLRKGLCEVIGQLIGRELGTERQIAVVPYTDLTKRLALQMKQRAVSVGIEIALVSADGVVHFQ